MAYIKIEKAIAEIDKGDLLVGNNAEWAKEILYRTPTADVEEVKHGYWKDRYGDKYHNHLYECSVCGKEALYEFYKNELDQWKERQALTPICPYCGAKMDGGKAE